MPMDNDVFEEKETYESQDKARRPVLFVEKKLHVEPCHLECDII